MASINFFIFIVQISKQENNQVDFNYIGSQLGEGSSKHYNKKELMIIDLWLEIRKFIESKNYKNELLIEILSYNAFLKIDEKFLDIF